MKVNLKKVDPDAVMPTYESVGAACFDLYSITDGRIGADVCRTGLAFEVPPGHVMMVFSRSGHGFKHGVRLANCTGIIDSDYRGEVMVKLVTDKDEMAFRKGDRVAQAMVVPVDQCEFEFVNELTSTVRGEGGFGSTGR